MLRSISIYLITTVLFVPAFGQQADTLMTVQTVKPPAPKEGVRSNVYNYKPGIDIPYTLAAVAFDLYAFSKIYNKEGVTQAELDNLNTSNINGFDRWAADVYRGEKPAKSSDF